MSDKRSPEDRVEKRRLSVEEDKIELNFLKTLQKLDMVGPKVNKDSKGRLTATPIHFRMAMLEVTMKLDLSGEEWDDDYNPKNGRDS